MRIALAASFVFALVLSAMQPAAAELAPHQQRALEQILRGFDSNEREAMRPQFEAMLAGMSEGEAAALAQAFAVEASGVEEEAPEPATLSRAEAWAAFEPKLRELWEANSRFDAVAAAKIAEIESRIAKRPYALYATGGGLRLGFYVDLGEPVGPYAMTRGYWEAMLPEEMSYRPFDFSGVRTGFDSAAVEAAIEDAYGRYLPLLDAFAAEMKAIEDKFRGDGAAREDAMFALTRERQQEATAINDDLRMRLLELRPRIQPQLLQIVLDAQGD